MGIICLTESEIEFLTERKYFIRDGFLDEQPALAAADALTDMFNRGALSMGKLSRGQNRRLELATRSDLMAWLDPENSPDALKRVFGAFQFLRSCLNETFYLGLQSFEVQVACYPADGSHYGRHLDAFPGSPNRRITSICYLNPGWQTEHGGMLRMYLGEHHLDVEPLLGRLVVFLSDQIEHEVLPVFALRRAVTAWYRQRSLLPVDA